MELRAVLPITLVLLGLGFLTTFISTFLASFLVKGIVDGIIILIILLVLAGLCLFLAFFHNDNPTSRTVYIIAAISAIFGGVVAISLPKTFHILSHYLNRTVVYFIIIAGVELSVCVFWPYLTNMFAPTALEAASIDRVHEAILYITSNLITSFVAALLVCVNNSVIGRRIAISVAAWFIGGIISAVIGLVIATKSGVSSGATGGQETQSINATTDYDKIG
ncbi:hypothetical protein GPJ56_005468 [Histomonas meleagridis]|uniref:uncharacterized protein n=1 Tax=Histomonas meleagridis TaxID=135588 RepID=UPI00355AC40C|nr:hypothetical protein GPJ56_005468 [Histomonas meleagridis]KAH0802492.1 hypothetical protein GO595_004541 [Histomonas meleagridis]